MRTINLWNDSIVRTLRDMRLAVTAFVSVAVASAACGHSPPAAKPWSIEDWAKPIVPFRVVGNVYDVGGSNIAVYAIKTSEGIVMIDSGLPSMSAGVLANLESLGMHATDIKILLNGHAHYDHVGGHAAIVKASGGAAKVMVMREDAEAVRTGVDRSPLHAEGWAPVAVDRELVDGDTVSLGGQTFTAHLTPGHTPGCTVWTTQVHDDDRDYEMAFYGCMRPNDSVKLRGNAEFPDLIAQTQESFRKMRALSPDIYVLMHPEDELAPVLDKLRAGVHPNPLASKAAWTKMLDEAQHEFDDQVKTDAAK